MGEARALLDVIADTLHKATPEERVHYWPGLALKLKDEIAAAVVSSPTPSEIEAAAKAMRGALGPSYAFVKSSIGDHIDRQAAQAAIDAFLRLRAGNE